MVTEFSIFHEISNSYVKQITIILSLLLVCTNSIIIIKAIPQKMLPQKMLKSAIFAELQETRGLSHVVLNILLCGSFT